FAGGRSVGSAVEYQCKMGEGRGVTSGGLRLSYFANRMETRTAVFDSARPLLFSIAYRMLGSVMDAEDLVQDAYLRWQEAPEADVRSPHAYLATIVTRL